MTVDKDVALAFMSKKWMNKDIAAELKCFCVRNFHTRRFCTLNANSLEKDLVLSADISF